MIKNRYSFIYLLMIIVNKTNSLKLKILIMMRDKVLILENLNKSQMKQKFIRKMLLYYQKVKLMKLIIKNFKKKKRKKIK